ncbi:MAG TPA: hypothetical protein VHX44_03980 [Planctomycetota bacterium]|nr:hypothetical protein [Planctomycetota bacterium]
MVKAFGIELKTDRFDQTSDLPEHINAGNKFYGLDLAEYIRAKLKLSDFHVIDEDWGWLVYGRDGELEINYGISDWHDVDSQFGGNLDSAVKTEANWYIVITAYKPKRMLGFIPFNQPVDCPVQYANALIALFKSDGVDVMRSGLE